MKPDDPRLDDLHEVLVEIYLNEGMAEDEDGLGATLGVMIASMVVCAEEQGIAKEEIFVRVRRCVDHLAQVACRGDFEDAGNEKSTTRVLQ